jgi:hypothetical protein
MKTNVHFILLILAGIVLTGCSNRVSVSGKVLLQSGEPVTQGLVIFENEKFSGISDIKEDGSYSIGLIKSGEGIPPGTYNIAIQATGNIGRAQAEMGTSSNGMSKIVEGTSQVDSKYTLTRTSGLSITVEKGKPMVHNIVVEKP